MALSGELQTLFSTDLPEGQQNLLDSYHNLERVAEYCQNNYFQAENKKAALEETKGYTTQSLASVAYQINTLAYNFLQMLDLQSAQLGEMESQVNHISQTVDIHKEKVARREIGILTTNKSSNRQYKIIAPANPERPAKYVRKPIDYSLLDDIGHGVKLAPPPQQVTPRQKRPSTQYGPGMMLGGSQYAPGGAAGGSASGGSGTYGSLGNLSSAGPAPTTKPPTPPQANRYSGAAGGTGTLSRGSKEYRTPPVVAPPQLPSNYAPNYPQQQQQRKNQQQYGTLPHPQVQMVHPVQQQAPGPEDFRNYGGATMPRLSSASMRSTASSHASSGGGSEATYGTRQSGTLGRQPMQAAQHQVYGTLQGGAPRQPLGQLASSAAAAASASQYGTTSGMNRPTQRPPSPPLPLPPPPAASQPQPSSLSSGVYARNPSVVSNYSRQSVTSSTVGMGDASSIYSRQTSGASLQQQQQQQQQQLSRQNSHSQQPQQQQQQQQQQPQQQPSVSRQNSQQLSRQLSRQSSHSSSPGVLPQDSALPGWVPKNYLEKVSAIYDYNADKEDELSFHEGSVIYVLKKNDDGWWEGVMDGITGLFPGNYVEASV